MKIIDYMKKDSFEQLVFCNDTRVGLNAIICIHDTTLGPALGGLRMRPYKSEDEAIIDAFRLARGMTYKSAAAGLNLGGGKAVIIGDPIKDKTNELLNSFGRFVESLNGKYITAPDSGTSAQDMQQIKKATTHVVGLPTVSGGSGDPSSPTAFGVYRGMKACAYELFGSDSLQGRTVAVQGLGSVGLKLIRYLCAEKSEVVATDVSEAAVNKAKAESGVTVVSPNEIYDVQCDIFSPCALGSILNRQTIPRLKCKIVVGCANNQLEDDECCDLLQQRGIFYAPDYIVNAGGVINVSTEPIGYDVNLANIKVAEVYNTMQRVITIAKSEHISTVKAANRLAKNRIADAKIANGHTNQMRIED